MSSAKKYIWSTYAVLWVYFIFFDSSFEQSDHIVLYLIFGWIPFIILHYLWRQSSRTPVAVHRSNEPDTLDENYSQLYSLIPREELIKVGAISKQIQAGLQQSQKELEVFLKKYRRDQEFFESDEAMDLEVSILDEFYRLDHQIKDLQFANHKVQKFFERMGVISEELNKGLDKEEARKKLDQMRKDQEEELAKMEVNLEFSKAIGGEIITMKRLYGKDFKGKKIKIDDIVKRIYEEHPEWQK